MVLLLAIFARLHIYGYLWVFMGIYQFYMGIYWVLQLSYFVAVAAPGREATTLCSLSVRAGHTSVSRENGIIYLFIYLYFLVYITHNKYDFFGQH